MCDQYLEDYDHYEQRCFNEEFWPDEDEGDETMNNKNQMQSVFIVRGHDGSARICFRDPPNRRLINKLKAAGFNLSDRIWCGQYENLPHEVEEMKRAEANTKILKHEFCADDYFVIELHEGAKILHVAEQGPYGKPERGIMLTLWAEEPRNAPVREYLFAVRGTGHTTPPEGSMDFLATVLTQAGYVWHVYGPKGIKK